MSRSRPRRPTSLRDTSESEKMEVAGSWDTLEWTKIEPIARTVSPTNLGFLLEAERVVVEGYGVVLVNTDEAGILLVTNFRLLFLSEGTRNILELGTIPLATIEKFNKVVVKVQSAPRQSEKTPARRLLQVIVEGDGAIVSSRNGDQDKWLVNRDGQRLQIGTARTLQVGIDACMAELGQMWVYQFNMLGGVRQMQVCRHEKKTDVRTDIDWAERPKDHVSMRTIGWCVLRSGHESAEQAHNLASSSSTLPTCQNHKSASGQSDKVAI